MLELFCRQILAMLFEALLAPIRERLAVIMAEFTRNACRSMYHQLGW
jgi:hypothetical protein